MPLLRSCLVRGEGGIVDVRNGSGYGARAWVGSSERQDLRVRMIVDIPRETYSVHVTPPGEAEILLAEEDAAFRDSQSAVTNLANLTKLSDPGDFRRDHEAPRGPDRARRAPSRE